MAWSRNHLTEHLINYVPLHYVLVLKIPNSYLVTQYIENALKYTTVDQVVAFDIWENHEDLRVFGAMFVPLI